MGKAAVGGLPGGVPVAVDTTRLAVDVHAVRAATITSDPSLIRTRK